MSKNSTSQNLRCKNDEPQQKTRQNDKMKTQDEKTMNFPEKHMKQHAMISNNERCKKDEKTVFATSLGRPRKT